MAGKEKENIDQKGMNLFEALSPGKGMQ